jgi:hypothetical protein
MSQPNDDGKPSKKKKENYEQPGCIVPKKISDDARIK